jgi:hypothetical protein
MIYSKAKNDSLVQFVTVSTIDKIVLKKSVVFHKNHQSIYLKYRPVNRKACIRLIG